MAIDDRPNPYIDARLQFVREQHTVVALKKAARRRPEWKGLETDEKLLADLAAVLRIAYGVGQHAVPDMTVREFSQLVRNDE